MIHRGKLIIVISSLILSSSAAQQTTFFDVAPAMNISHPDMVRYGGISFCDFDNDGLDDISMNSDQPYNLLLFKNNGNDFSEISGMSNVNDTLLTSALIWVDYDNDGDKDLFAGHYGSSDRLFRNDGNFYFSDVTISAGLSTDSATTLAACWGDYNNDGWIDLYTTNYSEFMPNVLYKNDGDGTFTDVTDIANVADTIGSTSNFKAPLAVVFFDYNMDGRQDIYIANDHHTHNTLFKNLGNGSFEDVSEQSQSDVAGLLMGIAVGDSDNNGYLDLYVTNAPFGNFFLRNNGNSTFTEIADTMGMAVNRVCWGTNFFDYDNDTDLDLFVAVAEGTAIYSNVLFENNGNGSFSQKSGIGLDIQRNSYGTSVGDLDNNGYLDIAVYNKFDLLNLFKSSGGLNNWIKLSLEGTISNRDGVGSIVEFFVGGTSFIRSTHCGISFLSQNSSVLTVGIGSADFVDSVKIYWQSGVTDVLLNLQANSHYSVRETFGIIPVELISFNALVNNQNIVLNWSTGTETNNRGFEIQRSEEGKFTTIGFLNGYGTTTEIKNYSFTDNALSPSSYSYRLKQLDYNGQTEYSDVINVTVSFPLSFSLEQNHPNPFNPGTVISWQLPVSGKVSLKIYNSLGEEIKTLVNEYLQAGNHSTLFIINSTLPSGVYFYQLQAGSFTETRKMVLVR